MLITIIGILIVLFVGLYFYNQFQFKKAEANYPPTGSFVTVNGIKLHFISAGTGQPVVFLHGGMLSSRDFKEVVQLAANQGYHAIAFDRPGYGYSERPKNENITPITQANIIRKALKQMGIEEPIILVGHSWSGTMTLAYAIQYPNEVAGIVTLAAAMYKEGYPAENGDVLSKIVTTPIIGDLVLHTLLKTPLAKGMSKSMVKATFAPEASPTSYEDEVFQIGFRPQHFRANREDVLAFPGTSKHLCKRYIEINVPIIIVVGEEDPFMTKEQGQRLKQDLPHAVLKMVPGIGHMIPTLHAQIVLDSIKELSTKQDLVVE